MTSPTNRQPQSHLQGELPDLPASHRTLPAEHTIHEPLVNRSRLSRRGIDHLALSPRQGFISGSEESECSSGEATITQQSNSARFQRNKSYEKISFQVLQEEARSRREGLTSGSTGLAHGNAVGTPPSSRQPTGQTLRIPAKSPRYPVSPKNKHLQKLPGLTEQRPAGTAYHDTAAATAAAAAAGNTPTSPTYIRQHARLPGIGFTEDQTQHHHLHHHQHHHSLTEPAGYELSQRRQLSEPNLLQSWGSAGGPPPSFSANVSSSPPDFINHLRRHDAAPGGDVPDGRRASLKQTLHVGNELRQRNPLSSSSSADSLDQMELLSRKHYAQQALRESGRATRARYPDAALAPFTSHRKLSDSAGNRPLYNNHNNNSTDSDHHNSQSNVGHSALGLTMTSLDDKTGSRPLHRAKSDTSGEGEVSEMIHMGTDAPHPCGSATLTSAVDQETPYTKDGCALCNEGVVGHGEGKGISTILLGLRLLAVVPAVVGCGALAWRVVRGKPGIPFARADALMAMPWALLTGIFCFDLTTGLTQRWLVYYSLGPTLLRLLSLQSICWPSTFITLRFIGRVDLLFAWIVVGTTTACSRSIQIWVTSNVPNPSAQFRSKGLPPDPATHKDAQSTTAAQRDASSPTSSILGYLSPWRTTSPTSTGLHAQAQGTTSHSVSSAWSRERHWNWQEIGQIVWIRVGILYGITTWFLLWLRYTRDTGSFGF